MRLFVGARTLGWDSNSEGKESGKALTRDRGIMLTGQQMSTGWFSVLVELVPFPARGFTFRRIKTSRSVSKQTSAAGSRSYVLLKSAPVELAPSRFVLAVLGLETK